VERAIKRDETLISRRRQDLASIRVIRKINRFGKIKTNKLHADGYSGATRSLEFETSFDYGIGTYLIDRFEFYFCDVRLDTIAALWQRVTLTRQRFWKSSKIYK